MSSISVGRWSLSLGLETCHLLVTYWPWFQSLPLPVLSRTDHSAYGPASESRRQSVAQSSIRCISFTTHIFHGGQTSRFHWGDQCVYVSVCLCVPGSEWLAWIKHVIYFMDPVSLPRAGIIRSSGLFLSRLCLGCHSLRVLGPGADFLLTPQALERAKVLIAVFLFLPRKLISLVLSPASICLQCLPLPQLNLTERNRFAH